MEHIIQNIMEITCENSGNLLQLMSAPRRLIQIYNNYYIWNLAFIARFHSFCCIRIRVKEEVDLLRIRLSLLELEWLIT